MIRKLHEKSNYNKLIGFHAGIYLLLSFATVTISYLLLPLAIAMLASLFLFENPKKRILSIISPLISLAITALFSLNDIPLVFITAVLAFIIALCYAKRKSKALCCLYLCSAFIIYLFLIFFTQCASNAGTLDFASVTEEMSKTIANAKIFIIDYTYQSLSGMSGISSEPLTYVAVEEAVHTVFEFWPTIIFILAFTVSGVSIKFFTHLVVRNCKFGVLKSFVAFTPPTLVAFFYVVIYLMSMISYGDDIFTLSISHISNSLMVVFAYLGFKYLKIVSQAMPKQKFLFWLAIGVVAVSPALGLALVSYVGVHMTVIFNRQQNI